MRNTKARNYIYHNRSKVMPSMYSDDEGYKGFLEMQNRIEEEYT